MDIEAWLSLVERCVRDAEVAGSNPVASIYIMYKMFYRNFLQQKISKFFVNEGFRIFFYKNKIFRKARKI